VEVAEMAVTVRDVILPLFLFARRLIAGLPITMLRISVLNARKDIGSILLFAAHHADLALLESGSPILAKDTLILFVQLALLAIGTRD
jgi:hypothetical protein